MRLPSHLWRTLKYSEPSDEDLDLMIKILKDTDGLALSSFPRPRRFYEMAAKNVPKSIIYMDQTEDLCALAIDKDPHALQYVREQTELLCLKAIKLDPHTLKYVNEQTRVICNIAIFYDTTVLRHVHRQTHEYCLGALMIDWKQAHDLHVTGSMVATYQTLENMKPSTSSTRRAWVKAMEPFLERVNRAVPHIRFATRDFWLKAVDINPFVVVALKNPEHEICLKAVTNEPHVLACLNRQTMTMIEAAVKVNGFALVHANSQTEMICAKAIMQNYQSIVFASEVTDWLIKVMKASKKLQEKKALNTC